MTPADINAALIQKGHNQRSVADALCVSQQAVFLVIHGKATSRRIAEHIAAVTGKPLGRLWPGRYQSPAPAARAHRAA